MCMSVRGENFVSLGRRKGESEDIWGVVWVLVWRAYAGYTYPGREEEARIL